MIVTPSPLASSASGSTERIKDPSYPRKLLLFYSIKGDLQGVAELIKKGVDPNYIDRGGYCPLSYAIEHCHLNLLRLLLISPLCDLNIRLMETRATPLILAAKHSSPIKTDMVKILTGAKGIEINAQDRDDRTALIFASHAGDLEVVKFFF